MQWHSTAYYLHRGGTDQLPGLFFAAGRVDLFCGRDLRVVHTKANLVEYVLVVDWASNVVRLVACVRPATGM